MHSAVMRQSVPAVGEMEDGLGRCIRINAHVHLHVDALPQIVHYPSDASFEICPSAAVSFRYLGAPEGG